MGTRADFYVGRGEQAEWLGSIAWDGYPSGIEGEILKCESVEQFRTMVTAYIEGRDDGTNPSDGWPWPWNNSQTTDYAYAFDVDKVWACPFGYGWFDPMQGEPDEDDKPDFYDQKNTVFPDMSDQKNVTMGKRSGTITLVANTSGRIDVVQ